MAGFPSDRAHLAVERMLQQSDSMVPAQADDQAAGDYGFRVQPLNCYLPVMWCADLQPARVPLMPAHAVAARALPRRGLVSGLDTENLRSPPFRR
jgi:hypothetical protein